LESYEINSQEESVLVRFHSTNLTIGYELHPDKCYQTSGAISEYMENLLKVIVSTGNILKITEYLERCYVMIGYETDDEFHMERFTAKNYNGLNTAKLMESIQRQRLYKHMLKLYAS